MVTCQANFGGIMDTDIFKALADDNRRLLLDVLYERDGQTLSELTKHLAMSRIGVMKHLGILEEAGLLTTKKVGREKFHYLNPVPIRSIYDRWVSKYAEPWVAGLNLIKLELESELAMTNKPKHVYQIHIRTTPEQLWDAITNPEMTFHYWYRSRVYSDWKEGSSYEFINSEGKTPARGKVLEADPPKRLVMTWEMPCHENTAHETPSRITWEIETDPKLPGVCQLTVTHDQFEGAPNTYQAVGGGWPKVLSGLKTLLETGHPLVGEHKAD